MTVLGFEIGGLPDVITSEQQMTFDSMLEEESQKFDDVDWTNDAGNEITVRGTPIRA